MINIQQALSNILASVYGKDVRQSIYDAIYQINDNANEALDLAEIKFGTAITSPTDPVSGFIEGTVYFNTTTNIIWKLQGGAWTQLGSMRSISSITLDSSAANVDTYKVEYSDGSSTYYNVTNGKDGAKGEKGTSISSVTLNNKTGAVSTYDINFSDSTPASQFTVSDGISNYMHVRYSAAFDGNPMTNVPSAATPYIGICITTQSAAPTDNRVYNWVKFIGDSGSGTGDMLASDYATKYAKTVDRAAALYDGANEILVTQLMKISDYDTNGDGTVDKADKANKVGNAVTSVLEGLTDNAGQLEYNGQPIGGTVTTDGTTITTNGSGQLTLASAVTTKLSKLSATDGTINVDNVKLNHVLGTVSNNKATFTDSKIGGSTVYLSEVYCSDSSRYIKSQTVSGNTLTVTFDDSVVGTTCVLQMFKKGV